MATKRERDEFTRLFYLPDRKRPRVDLAPLGELLDGTFLPELRDHIVPPPALDPELGDWTRWELVTYLRGDGGVALSQRLVLALVTRSTYTTLGAACRPILSLLVSHLRRTGVKMLQRGSTPELLDILHCLSIIAPPAFQRWARPEAEPLLLRAAFTAPETQTQAHLALTWGVPQAHLALTWGGPFPSPSLPPRVQHSFDIRRVMEGGSVALAGNLIGLGPRAYDIAQGVMAFRYATGPFIACKPLQDVIDRLLPLIAIRVQKTHAGRRYHSRTFQRILDTNPDGRARRYLLGRLEEAYALARGPKLNATQDDVRAIREMLWAIKHYV